MNSFIENINYVAGLDNLYGSGIELYKNNLSLKSVQHDIELKFSYYNNDDKKIHSIKLSEPGVLVGGINDTLLSFKTLVESSITGSEFTCVVNFAINNMVMVNINIVSNSDMYKTYELEMKIVTAGVVTYDVFGEVKDSLKILPSLAMITASDVDVMANAYEIKEDISTISENIANIETVSDSIANVNSVGLNIDNLNIVCKDIANVNTVASNIVGLNSIVSNMTEILLADDNAAIATAKALESSDSAAASLQSALDSAANAALLPNHIADITNPHKVTKSQIGLEFAENIADADKVVASAGKLTTARDISLSGDVSGTVIFDGSANVDMAVSIAGLDASKLVSGVIDAARLPSYVYVSALTGLNVFRADKVLASKDVANMIYSAGNLVKIRYTADTDVDYEVLTYSGSDLVNVAHYVDSVFKGDTVLTYSGGELVSSIFVGV